MIPASNIFDQSTIAALLNHDPIVTDSRLFFSVLDWSIVEQWEEQRSSRDWPAHSEAANVKRHVCRVEPSTSCTFLLLCLPTRREDWLRFYLHTPHFFRP